MKRLRALAIMLIAMATLSSCQQFQLTEKAEGFNPQKQPVKKIVILQPDTYRGSTDQNSLEHLHKNAYTMRLESTLIQSYKRAAERHGVDIVIPGISDTMNAMYFNSITMLQKELMETGSIYDLENKELSDKKFKKQLLSENLTISPELQNLQKIYGTPYFYHSMLIQTDRLYLLSVLADLSAGKIVYRDLKEVKLKPKKANLDMLVFDSFYEMLVLK